MINADPKLMAAGYLQKTPKGEPATVMEASSYGQSCATWNLTVAECHSFFVKVGDTAVLVYNTKPGPRVYIVYQVDLPSGKKYIGRASLPYSKGTPFDDAAEMALNRRFGRYHRAAKHLGFNLDNAHVIWQAVYDSANPADKHKYTQQCEELNILRRSIGMAKGNRRIEMCLILSGQSVQII